MPLITFGSMNFCNVSIEVLSPVCDVDTIRDEMAHVCKIAVQHALCTCLEPGHKLMYPCMPFVTEGLYQGLGYRPETIFNVSFGQ